MILKKNQKRIYLLKVRWGGHKAASFLVISRLTGESGGGLFKHLPDRGELGRVLVVVEASVHCDSLTKYTWLSVHWSILITANTPPIHSQANTQIYQHTTDRQPVSRLSKLRSQQTAASLPIHNGRKSRLSKLWSQLLLPPTNTTVDRVGLASFCCLQCVPQINTAQQQLLRNSRVINLNIWVR